MDDRTLKLIRRLASKTHVINLNRVVHVKGEPTSRIMMSNADMLRLMGEGHISIKNRHIIVTASGRRVIADPDIQKLRSRQYAASMRDRGWVRKSVWVSPADADRFDQFLSTMERVK